MELGSHEQQGGYTVFVTTIKRRTALLSPVVLMLGLGAITTLPAQAQDGNAIARKMVQTYKNLNTYSETSEAKILMLGGPQQIQTASLKYQKPSLFVSTTSDPQAGSLAIYSDGKKVTIYGGRQNVFTQRNYTGNFATTVAQYEKISKEMLDMNITQIISPIGFMLAGDLPNEGKQFKTMKAETVDGSACNVIQSAIDLTWLAKIVGKQTFLQDRCVVRLWVDKQNNLVRRGVINFVWKVTVKRPGKKDRLLVQGMILDETHKNLQVNAPVNFDVFRFAPPAGAKQLFQETR